MDVLLHALQVGGVKQVHRLSLKDGIVDVLGLSISIYARALPFNNLVLFEGVGLPEGMPKSARYLAYMDNESGVMHAPLNPKILRVTGLRGQVREDLAESDEFKVEGDLVLAQVSVQVFLIPKSKQGDTRAIAYRYKPRSLGRQYVMIQSFEEEVLFLTCNSWS